MRHTFTALALILLPWLASCQVVDDESTVLITGANRGVGLALVKEFQEIGFNVIGTARNPDSATDLKSTGARVIALDVTSQSSVDAMAELLDGISIDVVVNNAGILGGDSTDLARLDIEDVSRVMDVNTLGPLRVIQALHPNVRDSERKMFVNISSMMGSNTLNTFGQYAGYRASKAALNAINKTFAEDFGEDGLVFVVMHPGYVQTDINNGRGEISSTESASGLVKVIRSLDEEDNGKFYDWQGDQLPW